MNLSTFFEAKNIVLDVESQDHFESLAEVMQKIPHNGRLRNKEKALRDLMDREQLSSTGIGGGFAVPHVFTEEAHLPTLVFARSRKGIEFKSLDNKPVHLLLLAFAHPRKKSFFILCLYHIVQLLKDPVVFNQLMEAEGAEEIMQVFEQKGVQVPPELLKPISLENGDSNGQGKLESKRRERASVPIAASVPANGGSNGRENVNEPEEIHNHGNGRRGWGRPLVTNPIAMVGHFLARAAKEVDA